MGFDDDGGRGLFGMEQDLLFHVSGGMHCCGNDLHYVPDL